MSLIMSAKGVIQAESQKKSKFIVFAQSFLFKTSFTTTNMLYD